VKGKELVESAEARLEAAKLSADWCKWMMALQTGICAGLWTPLKNSPKSALLWAWVAFALSALTTSWLLGRLPGFVSLLAETGAEPQKSTRIKELQRIALLAHVLFTAGIVIAIYFVLARAAAS
jgi:hypothetical protein